jgi:hypothetical protein
MEPKIEYQCAGKHPAGRMSGPLVTINDGKWAYCSTGGADHAWHRIHGRTLGELARSMPVFEDRKDDAPVTR